VACCVVMKAVDFCLHRPGGVGEALGLLAEFGDEGKVLAGGQSLVPLLNFRLAQPAHVIDIGRLPLTGIAVGDEVTVGALVRQAALVRIADRCPLVAAAVPWIAHPPIRARGTLGGSLAHADPAAELPAVAVALDATMVTTSRQIPAADFFFGYLSTVLSPSELLTEIRFPVASPATGAAFTEFARRRGDFALAGCAAQLAIAGGLITDARICLSGVGPVPVRCHGAERLLGGQRAGSDVFRAAAETAAAGLDPPSDLHASGEYRRHLASVLARRALEQAADRAGNAAP
jgi:carbon-monoxide dehydrogenase medium subunit